MPTTYAIIQGNKYMDATTYTGSGVQTVVNASGFKPDLVWTKTRSATGNNLLIDSVRGAANYLISNTTGTEGTDSNYLTSFNSNGYSLGSSNYASGTLVGWQWAANQGSNVTNTTGTVTSTVSANATAGFSIVTYTTTGANATIGHGLSVAPSMIILKNRTTTLSWGVWNTTLSTPSTALILLDTTAAQTNAGTYWNNAVPTSSVFSMGTAWASGNYVAYCWAPVAGFSQFGSYTGNGSADGPFIYTGFRPKYVMYKQSNGANAWVVVDSARDLYNAEQNLLLPNTSGTEFATSVMDFVSNGFKIRYAGSGTNGSGETIIYAAFAETPFKYANAR